MKIAIHTIRFSREYFLTYEACASWLAEKSIQNLGYDEADNFYIFKQVSKEKFNDASFQEISLGSGVSAVVGVISNSDNTLANITDADTIVPNESDTELDENEIESNADKKSQVLSVLTTAFDTVKDFISESESKKVADTIVTKKENNPNVQLHVPIIKKTAQKIVFGAVLVPDEFDGQKHIYSEEEVEKAAHYWMKEFQQLGEMHNKMLKDGQVVLLESYVAPVEFSIDGETVKKGTWLLKLYISDDDLWEKIKDGEYNGFSIQGLADAETLDEDDDDKEGDNG